VKNPWIKTLGVYPLIILTQVFWGLSYIWTTIAFEYYQPITIIFIRLLLSSVFLVVIILFIREKERIKPSDRWLILVAALLNPFLYFLSENFGLKNSTPTISAVIISTIPLFTSFAGHFMLREKLSWLNISGVVISFIGITIMMVNPDLSLNSPVKGLILLGFAVISAVVYSVLLKRLAGKYSALTIITYQNILGTVYFLPLFLIYDLDHFLTVVPDARLITSLLQLSLFASTLAFIFYTMSVKEIGISRTSIFSNLMPVFTAIFSAIFISEIFSATKITGMAIVITGVIVSQIKDFGRKS
jgi:drug/metabolite transporter (DMT)-like permease